MSVCVEHRERGKLLPEPGCRWCTDRSNVLEIIEGKYSSHPPEPRKADSHEVVLADLADIVADAQGEYDELLGRRRKSAAVATLGLGIGCFGALTYDWGFGAMLYVGLLLMMLGGVAYVLLHVPPERGETEKQRLRRAKLEFARKQRRPQ